MPDILVPQANQIFQYHKLIMRVQQIADLRDECQQHQAEKEELCEELRDVLLREQVIS